MFDEDKAVYLIDGYDYYEYQRALGIVKDHYAGMGVDVDSWPVEQVIRCARNIEMGWD